jgi:hypothetical protein
MQTAFFFGGFLPPPTAFAFVLAGAYGFGARFAADRNKTTVMQFVVGQVIAANIIPHIL